MSEGARQLLRGWLRRQLDAAQNTWLDEQLANLEEDPSDGTLAIALGMAPRRLGKADLQFDAAAAAAALEGWDPAGWSVVDAARVLMLSGLPAEGFGQRFQKLCRTADVAELVSLYRGLPLYPNPAALEPQVGEGLRSNMRSVFEAIAHRNPYPRRYFDQHRWNHMVLKALFIGSPLDPIQGVDERANPELARILCDFAHERWAASRPVPPDVWRCVGPFAEGAVLEDLLRVLRSNDSEERRAGAAALAASRDPRARQLLQASPR
jgi:hypothetical protein